MSCVLRSVTGSAVFRLPDRHPDPDGTHSRPLSYGLPIIVRGSTALPHDAAVSRVPRGAGFQPAVARHSYYKINLSRVAGAGTAILDSESPRTPSIHLSPTATA